MSPVETESIEARPATPPRSPAFVLAVSLAVLFGILSVTLGILLAGDGGGDDHSDLRQRAGEFGEALFTYDHRDPDAHRDAVLALSTGSFTEEYEDSFEQSLRQLMTEVQATSEGTVKEIYLAEVDDGRAEVIVVADAEQDGAAGPRTVYDLYVKLTLVRVEGTWRVDDLVDLNFPVGDPTVATGGSGATSTTSSATPVP